LLAAGVEVVEGVCESEIRRQLGSWVLAHHAHEILRRARTDPALDLDELAQLYAVDPASIAALLR
jgi:diaminohydroxyphosphoribosylaminopyrimidine deaminase/5-amino-6-(5-phosphoribosylamino)uracil reductase